MAKTEKGHGNKVNVSGNVPRTPPQGSLTLGGPFKKRRSFF